MARFSIIVPYLGDAILFEQTLASVLRHQPVDSEVIVAHDGTYEDVHQLKDEIEFVETERKAQLIRLFNCGLRQSESDYVAFIRPGIDLPANWSLSIEERFESDAKIASISPAIISSENTNRLVTAGVQSKFGFVRKLAGVESRMSPRSLRTITPLGPSSWAAFYRRSALEQYGTPDETLDPLYLDLDLALGLKTLGYTTAFVPEVAATANRPTVLIREALDAHGMSAQRACRRHPAQGSYSFFSTITWELVRSPMNPLLFRHLSERFSAKQFADIDDCFARRLKEKRALAKLAPTSRAVSTPAIRRAA